MKRIRGVSNERLQMPTVRHLASGHWTCFPEGSLDGCAADPVKDTGFVEWHPQHGAVCTSIYQQHCVICPDNVMRDVQRSVAYGSVAL